MSTLRRGRRRRAKPNPNPNPNPQPQPPSPSPSPTPKQAVRLGEAAAGSALLRRRLEAGITPKTLELAVRLALCEVTTRRATALSPTRTPTPTPTPTPAPTPTPNPDLNPNQVTPARPLPSLAAIERGLRQQTLPGASELLRQLSVVELLLLLALKKLGDREAPPPHTLRMVLREYNSDFLVSIERGQALLTIALLTVALLTMAMLTLASLSSAARRPATSTSPNLQPQPQP
jgi:hypothetical protein